MLGEGDPVYLLDDRGKRYWLRVQREMVKVQGLGVVDAGRLIGLKDGSRMKIAGREFFVFRGGLIEQMESLDRGPQIITAKDAATMVFHLDLAGDVVLEAGVGSGALTIALLHAVAPTGKVVTVELGGVRPEPRRNVERSGLSSLWDLRFGDIRRSTWGPGGRRGPGHARPWLALDNIGASSAGGRFRGIRAERQPGRRPGERSARPGLPEWWRSRTSSGPSRCIPGACARRTITWAIPATSCSGARPPADRSNSHRRVRSTVPSPFARMRTNAESGRG